MTAIANFPRHDIYVETLEVATDEWVTGGQPIHSLDEAVDYAVHVARWYSDDPEAYLYGLRIHDRRSGRVCYSNLGPVEAEEAQMRFLFLALVLDRGENPFSWTSDDLSVQTRDSLNRYMAAQHALFSPFAD